MTMYLYHFTLQKPSAITHAVYGNFSAPKAQEIVISRGKLLELLRPDDNGKVQTIVSVEIFGIIRSIQSFRLTGSSKDLLVIGSDSGRIVILDFNAETNSFDKVHQETYGRSGCRRIVPGQYLAIDPKGRALMIAAIEKQKFVYILNRDSSANLTISSPLEAHKAHSIVLDVCGIDVGFDNPLFGCIELDYEDVDQDPTGEAIKNAQKHLTLYELDLGLNHVVRQSSEPIPRTTNMIVSVPGGSDGPGGVLLACQDYIYHRTTEHEDKKALIPRRRDIPRKSGLMMTSWVLVKQRDWFFFLFQSEYGDLYKVSLDYDEDGNVHDIKIKYFDTVPLAVSLAVLKTGFMFVASEAGNHALYQFQAIGDGDDEETFQIQGDDEHIYFKPRPLRNLLLIDEMQSAMPITDLMVENLFKEETPQIFAACGRSHRSSLRVLRHGIAVTERALRTLPGLPSAVWSIKTHVNDEYDKYIIVSFRDATMVLYIGETVEEVHDSGLLRTAPTLHASMLGEDAIVQIHPDGIRHIRTDKRIQEWQPAPGKKITMATVNERQIIAVIGTNEIIYFELDPTGTVVEIEKKELEHQVVAVGIAPVPEGRQRARFLAVADTDNKMRIYSLAPGDCLQSLSMLMLPSRVVSLKILEMSALGGGSTSLYVNMGTGNGVFFRATLDKLTGQLTDNRARFLGNRPVKLFNVTVNGAQGILALSSRSWLCYNFQGRFRMMPLSYVPLEYASSFNAEQCPEGIVSIAADSLRIFTTEQLGDMFNQTSIPLRYTPRRMLLHPPTQNMIIIESDNDTYPYAEKQKLNEMFKRADGEENQMNVDEGEVEDLMPESIFGVPRPGSGKWASCLRIMDVARSRTIDLLEMENNETALCMCFCAFQNKQAEMYLCVATAKDLVFEPRRMCSEGYIHVYRLLENGTKFSLVHKTPVQDVPGAICEYNGRLLVGVGPVMRIYDLGKKKLLRKCESKKLPNFIVSIWLSEDKIIIGDIQHSYHFARYNRPDNIIYIFADDFIPRWLTSGCLLDPTTIAAGDKFGNIFVLRLPDKVNQQLEEDPTGGDVQWNTKDIVGAPHKLDMLINFYVGETITKVVKTSITPGGSDVILYSTIFGSVGAFLPFQSREDIDFFTNLEMHMRAEYKSLCGREHLSFRSYYAPCRNVVDGDLCEQFPNISPEQQKKVAESLERSYSPAEVLKKLEEMRNIL
eukprot:TRINITY_DN6478_c0_g1_i1.p1 TRINITY_DN6478_c0_g1~~TRINITY_DN6478_c0_g1_i1.p1  ORF type:complete len:1199 (-),score=275.88 TRINITY_DN6478_c0_g1_i1:1875-5471(-)